MAQLAAARLTQPHRPTRAFACRATTRRPHGPGSGFDSTRGRKRGCLVVRAAAIPSEEEPSALTPARPHAEDGQAPDPLLLGLDTPELADGPASSGAQPTDAPLLELGMPARAEGAASAVPAQPMDTPIVERGAPEPAQGAAYSADGAAAGDALFTTDRAAWRWRQLRAIAAFVLPALAIPLSDPLMSVLDTVCVGRFSSTMELAGLGPATLVFFLITNLFLSQGMAVTALVSRALEERDIGRAQRALSAGIAMALVAGVIVTGLTYAPGDNADEEWGPWGRGAGRSVQVCTLT